MLVKILKPDFTHADERGRLVQLVHNGWNQVNVIHSKKNSERGGHYHEFNTEAFYVISGSLKLLLNSGDVFEETTFKTGDMFLIGPKIKHSFTFIEDTCLISMYDLGVELNNGTKDILQ